MKNICILGATGSIGTQTLDVIEKESNKFKLVAFSANKSYEKIITIIEKFNPVYGAINDKETFLKVKDHCNINNIKINLLYGMDGLIKISTLEEVELVVTSIVGMIGLVPTLEAINAGKDIALANKETLVTGGELVMKAAKQNNVKILPVDSEHGAIFQCLQGNSYKDIETIYVTASGGPFRQSKLEELINITPEQALKHPKWNMGKKISIDSSTMINKGLEVIEAHWLFNVGYDKIKVLVHPQSIVHSMVEYIDGSIIAQLASTDMRLPIQYALNYPVRNKKVVEKLDVYNMGNLTFEKPDFEKFRGLKLAYEAGKLGGIMPTIFNASNEVAVNMFLNNHIKYLEIVDIVEECMNKFENKSIKDVEDILNAEAKVRSFIKNKYNF
ncbi:MULTISPECIES: 1-deoxy-D-xylulose-5-phosphate reductoisomerase [Clostridium]|uniref:1-deoxy-D-xylulose 5-phosphate reductoisomerase n=1 Tax=Clostridium novyi (strain NT) TaxID=386415 RepID=DXR_CLONN|nr:MULTISPECIES: 1-deoxy-D-xylulose-5-phosphate reductoisomerase [Clostridium]A0Q0R4.1 RecName: Full=1-deoxy-D-xylulose 5-phosphate reductoisomerase; Short=DXP reductoisomerase; AltName: Full=1-deoxyxylulose-5-phosphate reductoisomerase; AltName: Full=2-C-methyl-D-erythritol 4-phosphate synthase [Clostridium novyi NT]ABK61080.1 1-deoxy-D-xylulose 5-phosphate reductoisomerase [Clostridium novyi NT]KEH88591.1 1-deoxy-D-xylulose 5-phosphate reductoisomerase [Clostridium novyi A str. NCTC 538]KEH94